MNLGRFVLLRPLAERPEFATGLKACPLDRNFIRDRAIGVGEKFGKGVFRIDDSTCVLNTLWYLYILTSYLGYTKSCDDPEAQSTTS